MCRDELDKYRYEIDSIDKEMVRLFEKRMDLSLKVAEYKKKNNLEIYQQDREVLVLEKAVSNLENKEYSDSVKEFMINIMKISKNIQREYNHE